jgi:hypothetical protein
VTTDRQFGRLEHQSSTTACPIATQLLPLAKNYISLVPSQPSVLTLWVGPCQLEPDTADLSLRPLYSKQRWFLFLGKSATRIAAGDRGIPIENNVILGAWLLETSSSEASKAISLEQWLRPAFPVGM